MSLGKEDVARIAELARLQIEQPRLNELTRHLSAIIDFVAKMDQAPTEGVEPMAHPLDLSARLRDDVVTETDQREKFQSIAPAVEDGLYLVPRVIE
ncbi:MAG: Asp-tRNA(Asn)/Glu-tRNA(Gln) amidotransferase subunit GatC [Gammaproteobacteria bacterium]|nr:MAG: Asp-tRNA(Asn)/Glu-tRNA(Gln) amidotransferase subunit GatC [Gammaproteobacteria bacterium]